MRDEDRCLSCGPEHSCSGCTNRVSPDPASKKAKLVEEIVDFHLPLPEAYSSPVEEQAFKEAREKVAHSSLLHSLDIGGLKRLIRKLSPK